MYYTFKYNNSTLDEELSMTFRADLEIGELVRQIRYFLLAASWSPELLDKYGLKEDPESITESE